MGCCVSREYDSNGSPVDSNNNCDINIAKPIAEGMRSERKGGVPLSATKDI
jgi:hypothetical protein